MNVIPLVKLYYKNSKKEIEKQQRETQEKLKTIENYEKIYFLDYAGLEKNKPNLCIYQKTSKDYEIIVDAGPRNTGDIVDNLMSGATNITIRTDIWEEEDILKIKKITENPIYQIFKNNKIEKTSVFEKIDAVVLLNQENETDYNQINYLQKLSESYEVFYYEKNPDDKKYLEKTGIQNLIVDIEKIKEFY